jgi:hypothetical protein
MNPLIEVAHQSWSIQVVVYLQCRETCMSSARLGFLVRASVAGILVAGLPALFAASRIHQFVSNQRWMSQSQCQR